jgi:replicative superfamily II helicase
MSTRGAEVTGSPELSWGSVSAVVEPLRRQHPTRLTSVLRAVHGDGTPLLSVEDMLLKRTSLLSASDSLPQSPAASGRGGKVAPPAVPQAGFSSAWFCAGVPERSSMFSQGRLRANELLSAVQEAFGGDAPPDEVSSAAMTVFRAAAAGSEEPQLRESIKTRLFRDWRLRVAEKQCSILCDKALRAQAWFRENRSDEALRASAASSRKRFAPKLLISSTISPLGSLMGLEASSASSLLEQVLRISQPSSGEVESAPEEESSSEWLLRRCRELFSKSALPPQAMAESIASAVRECMTKGSDPSTDPGLQTALFDLIGEHPDGFEFLGQVIERAPALKDFSAAPPTHMPAAAAVVVGASKGVSVEHEGVQKRKQRKGGPASTVADGPSVFEAGMMSGGVAADDSGLVLARSLRHAEQDELMVEASQEAESLRQIRDFRTLVGGTGDRFVGEVDSIRASLPEGATETRTKEFVEIHIPAPESIASKVDPSLLVSISELDEWAQVAFSGVERLNPLQSTVFETAYHSSENMLVCAPTGAGKTNVAMLAVCRELSRHFVDGVLQRDDFKIVYVAPMKALAAEVTAKFGSKLAPLGVKVREFTGDMQLSRKEVADTQMLVVTPEKWDVVTRKSGEGGSGITSQVRLLIIDEVHLLADTRGSVIESIVARTLRQVEASQSVIRLVGLSATLPNYQDVGLFLRVNPESGLFHFNASHRPVPLAQTFVGIADKNPRTRRTVMTRVAYDHCISAILREKQAMVFVHSRNDTWRTGQEIASIAAQAGTLQSILAPRDEDGAFIATLPSEIVKLIEKGREERGEGEEASLTAARKKGSSARVRNLLQKLEKSRNHQLRELVTMGIAIHHAGMLRPDRTLAEQLFMEGHVKILVCTATLAWGVNLPAHTVIIKGTDVYNAEAGGFQDLSVLDVLQIFGRAGRPQFDSEGEAVLLTGLDCLPHYQQRLLHQSSIESSFIKSLPDHLNAEVVSGSVTNIREAVMWLSYSYLFVRMLRNPTAYGVRLQDCRSDPMLEMKRIELACTAAKRLDECRLLRYDERSGMLASTDMGRVASHYYIRHESMDLFFRELERHPPSYEEAIALICRADEFKQLRFRDEEEVELRLLRERAPYEVKGDVGTTETKCNILLQAFISNERLKSFTLIGDTAFITQSAGRIARGLFEISVRRGWGSAASTLLALCKAIDRRVWWHDSPLRQLVAGYSRGTGEASTPAAYAVTWDSLSKVENGPHGEPVSIDYLRSLSKSELDAMMRIPRLADRVRVALTVIPRVTMAVSAQPITRNVLRVSLKVTPSFRWVDRLHGGMDGWWVWVEDDRSEKLYHHEQLALSKAMVMAEETQELSFTIPVPDPLPPQLWVRATNDSWQGVEEMVELSMRHMVLPDEHPPHTDLLDLVPVPKGALQNPLYEKIYSFSHFNPIQSQIFHVLYHTDHNVLLGAPTGSGKTVAAELAVFRLMNERPKFKAVYIAPLKALVSERMSDWKKKFESGDLRRKVVELTGDVTPDVAALKRADILVTTPEKWDGISRSWHKRGYVQQVGLVIIDEIHLLGEDRGPVLEVIVSRMRYISAQTGRPIRIVGLSTALANAVDLADWLGIDRVGLYNFRPSVRPIPMDVHIQGFPGKHYCPRMATMNKPIYAAVATHSPEKPVLVFVSSRRQTRLTALELISLCASDENPRRFLHMDPEHCQALVDATVKDAALKHTLVFGVGIHHAGLCQADRDLVEELFVGGSIQILVCTSTLAWGVNFPAHLVVVKGTEFFDGKIGRYVDFPITDVLQMMGRAGRPQYDSEAVAVIMVHEPKKQFYRKFLYEPFPVESQLLKCLHDHINAEIAGGTITSRADAVDYLTWTYFFRRLVKNPSFYHLESAEASTVSAYLTELIDRILHDLASSGCIVLGEAAALELGIDPAEERAKAAALAKKQLEQQRDEAFKKLTDVMGASLGPKSRQLSEAASEEEEQDAPVVVEDLVAPTTLGQIASFYYLSHKTVDAADTTLHALASAGDIRALTDHSSLLRLICDASEFDPFPVRHNEEMLNEQLADLLPWPTHGGAFDNPHVKAYLLLQAAMARVPLPISDFINDTKSVQDQAPRILNALVDIAANLGHLRPALSLMELSQCLAQNRLPEDSSLLQVPGANDAFVAKAQELVGRESAARCAPGVDSPGLVAVSLVELVEAGAENPSILDACVSVLPSSRRRAAYEALKSGYPRLHMECSIQRRETPLLPGDECDLQVKVRCVDGASLPRGPPLPPGAKPKPFGWWLVTGHLETGELTALKRVSIRSGETSLSLKLQVPDAASGEWSFDLFLMSDAVASFDMQLPVRVPL